MVSSHLRPQISQQVFKNNIQYTFKVKTGTQKNNTTDTDPHGLPMLSSQTDYIITIFKYVTQDGKFQQQKNQIIQAKRK